MCDKKLFSCGFLCCTIHNRSPPDHRPLTIISHRQRKRWDENTTSSKRPHRPRACLCASIAIFRIAPPSWERALSAETALDPYCPFSESPSYKVILNS